MCAEPQVLVMSVGTSVSTFLEPDQQQTAQAHIPRPAVVIDSVEQQFYRGESWPCPDVRWLLFNSVSSCDVLLRCLRLSCAWNKNPQRTRVVAGSL